MFFFNLVTITMAKVASHGYFMANLVPVQVNVTVYLCVSMVCVTVIKHINVNNLFL